MTHHLEMSQRQAWTN